ncbi:MAG: hypothetical protein EKK29_08400 [Hyphomicrobiales bacterium]|nr:MAG: hypothetical protein EKK29_08400 [Hyphomicrobiales bacterium]
MQAEKRRGPYSEAQWSELEDNCFVAIRFLVEAEGSRNAEHYVFWALETFDKHMTSGLALPEEWRNELLQALIYFREIARDTVSHEIDFDVLWEGLEAAFAQVLYWGTPLDQRAKWRPDYVAAANTHAETLRNSLHDFTLNHPYQEERLG